MKMHWRPLITVLVLLIWAPYLFADEFEIRNFKKDPSDYTAARSGRNDINGQACAILKVRTDLTGLSFECNQGFTGDPEYKTGEVWLYLSPKEKRIKFMKEGFIPKDFLFTEAIESATVYMIELTKKFITGTDVIQSMGFVLIKSNPTGAEVNLNGEPTGMKTPFSKALALGNHQLTLNKELYLSYKSSFEITAGKTTTLEIPLTVNFGSLTVASKPESGAEVWIDGQSAGETTPTTMEMLSAGNHSIIAKKEMYEALEQDFTITSGKETILNLTLVPTYGTISISTTPPAEIWIDQSRAGTETYSGRLLKGLHMVEARLDKHYTITESVTMEVDKPLSLKWQMVPKTGTLAINSDPPEASIYLDGTLEGTSPLFIEKIIVGDHSIRFTKTGHGEVIKQISLQENQTLDINEKLPTGVEVTINSTPSGAEVWMDSIKKGVTPLTETFSFGNHTLKLILWGYEEITQSFNVDGKTNELSFKLSKSNDGTFVDSRDGQAYKYIIIGDQIWMGENLNFSTIGSWCYDDKSSNCLIYGRLYDLETAQLVCPQGWHLPIDSEWQVLVNYLGGENIAGGEMKETGTSHWKSPNSNATNSSSFTGLPGGFRNTIGDFVYLFSVAQFWSSPLINKFPSSPDILSGSLWSRGLKNVSKSITRGNSHKDFGFSVRCIRDK